MSSSNFNLEVLDTSEVLRHTQQVWYAYGAKEKGLIENRHVKFQEVILSDISVLVSLLLRS